MENQVKTYYALKFVLYVHEKQEPIVFFTPKTTDSNALATIEEEFYTASLNEEPFTTQIEDNDNIGWVRINTEYLVMSATYIESYTF